MVYLVPHYTQESREDRNLELLHPQLPLLDPADLVQQLLHQIWISVVKWQWGVSTEWHLAVRRQDFITMPGDLREDTSELTGLQNCIDNVHHCTVHVHCTHKSSSSLSPSQRITLPSHLPLQALLLLLHTSVEDVRELRIRCQTLRDKNNVASIIVSQVRHLFIRYFFVIICSTNC